MLSEFDMASIIEIQKVIRDMISKNEDKYEEIKAIIVGAFYSFYLAMNNGYSDDLYKGISKRYLNNIIINYDDLSDKAWIAGFYLNSCLYRLSAAFHRVMKVINKDLASKDNVHELYEKALSQRLTDVDVTNLKKVHNMVNNLKHEVFGLSGTRPAINTVYESFKELLKLCEDM